MGAWFDSHQHPLNRRTAIIQQNSTQSGCRNNWEPKTKFSYLTCPVDPFFILNLERSTPLKLMLRMNRQPWSSSPQAVIIPLETPKPATMPRIVLATLPPAIVIDGGSSFSKGRIWALILLNIWSKSLAATYLTEVHNELFQGGKIH